MPTIEDQLEWETQMSSRGVQRFRTQQTQAAESSGHETSAGSRLLREYLLPVSSNITAYLSKKHPTRRRNKYAKLLDGLNPDKAALLTLKEIINGTLVYGSVATVLCSRLGRMCEDELRFTKFELSYKEYWDSLIRDFKRKNTTSYSHKRRVLSKKGADRGMEWVSWSPEEAVKVGALLVSLLLEVCDLAEKVASSKVSRKRAEPARIVPTQACLDWISKHDAVMEITNPDRMPCLIQPAEWVDTTSGGYYSPMLRSQTPLIRVNNDKMTKHRAGLYDNADMPEVLSAVNAVQSTKWTVNTELLEAVKEVWSKGYGCGLPRAEPYDFPLCPLSPETKVPDLPEGDPRLEAFMNWKAESREMHTREKNRVSQNLSLVRTLRMAQELREYPEFWFVYQLDFRGRMYCVTYGLSPQGTDSSKAMLRFAEGKELGTEGLFWFSINGANKFGYDKVSNEDRVSWVEDNAARFYAAGSDPVANREIWSEADKPWQFLAWCMEFAALMDWSGDGNTIESFVSHLPVGLDGSCNGLQHFSAMLRDTVGGQAVNLLPSDVPSDIYQQVADVCLRKVQASADAGEAAAINWLKVLPEGKIPRSLAKKPVMTLPYGSTPRTCVDSIAIWIQDNIPESFPENTSFKHAIFLSPLLWDSISEVVVAARAAMDWIQACAGILADGNHPMEYTSPLGFPVLQTNMHYKSKKIETQIAGRLNLRISSDTKKLNRRKQRQGSSPNLIHHVDACHMMMVVNKCREQGIVEFAMIHDDFGTHAADAGKMQIAIRQAFVELHSDFDILQDFKDVHERRHQITLPDPPEKGNLSLSAVFDSEYFFG